MTINKEVNAGDLLQQIDGAVAGRLLIDTQVAQAHDVIAVSQFLYLLGGDGKHLLTGSEGQTLDLGRIGLGSGLGSIQTEHADGGAVRSSENHVLIQGSSTVGGDVGGQDGELGLLSKSLQVVIAIVKLVVAGDGHVIADHIHQLDGGSALGNADGRLTLDEVTSIHDQNVSAFGLVLGLQGCHLGIAVNSAVDVVGMQDHDGAVVLDGVLSRVLSLGKGSDGHAQSHDHRQQQGEELVPLSHAVSS